MPTILVVDDDPAVREIIGQSLIDAGMDVVDAATGRDALDVLNRQIPDLVVTDIMMPDCDGIQLVCTLRRTWPELPLIAVSGSTAHSEVFLRAAKHLGADRVLAKPFQPALLVSIVRAILAPQADGAG